MARVLVVDDEHSTTRLVQRLLEREGHEVETAGDGDAAMKKIGGDYDVLLLDIMMPGAKPKDVLEKLKEIKAKTRVYYFSALKQDDPASQRVRSGQVGDETHEYIVGYIEKPFDNKELVEKIRMAAGETQ